MRRPNTIFMYLILCPLLAGCGSIVNGSTQNVMVTSEPDGVEFTVNMGEKHTTPATLSLSRKADHLLEFEAPDCTKQTRTVKHSASGATFVNIIFPIGFIFDALGGGMWKLEPAEVHVRMQPDAEPTKTAGKGDGDLPG